MTPANSVIAPSHPLVRHNGPDERTSANRGVICLEYAISTPTGPRIVSVDPAAERMTGYPAAALMGQPFGMIYDPDGLDSLLERLHTRICRTESFCWADKFLIKKGGRRELRRWKFSPIKNEKGLVCGFAVFVENLPKKKTHVPPSEVIPDPPQTDVDSFLDNSRSETLALIAGGIAHDFKNSLQPVKSTLEMLRMSIQSGSKSESLISDAELALEDAVELAKQMMAFTKGYESERRIIHLRDLLEHAAYISTMGTDVRCDQMIAGDLLPVKADPKQMYQIFQNIIINGCQAMPGGGVIQISAGNGEAGNGPPEIESSAFVEVRIRDRGCGIERENLEKIFDLNYTTKENGTGVGLASCQAIIHKHGGKIMVDSTPNVGTEVVILLPACADGKSRDARPRPTRPTETGSLNRVRSSVQPSSSPSSKSTKQDPIRCHNPAPTGISETPGGRILIVDDQIRVLTTAEKLLQFLGYETLSATSGEQALDLYREHLNSAQPIDAVLLDMTLPGGLSGREVKSEINKIDGDARIIATSGYFEKEHPVETFLNEGWIGVLPKPYAIDALAATVKRALLQN